jgi:hypothetical protein
VPDVTPPPDGKDWTWVLQRRCPQCGTDVSGLPPQEVAGLLRAAAARWQQELTGRADLAQRPEPAVWSPLEYGCHVRDVCRRFDRRVELMLTEQDPVFENWDQDATAVEERYGEQDAATVAAELDAAAARLADRFDTVSGAGWDRQGRRDNGSTFTVATLARYFLHDVLHHLWDVTGHGWSSVPAGARV